MAMGISPFVGQKLGSFVAAVKAEDLASLTELIESGRVTPTIDRTYPLSGVAEAIRYLQDGQARGKVVITLPGT
jgi:NADPH:quinone reductase-like Zn-dependent oxidoreductase